MWVTLILLSSFIRSMWLWYLTATLFSATVSDIEYKVIFVTVFVSGILVYAVSLSEYSVYRSGLL